MRFTMLSALAMVGLVAGCEVVDSGSTDDTGISQGPPGADMPAWCAEIAREEVVDLSVAPADFAFLASDAIDSLTGSFAGELVPWDANGGQGQQVGASLVLSVSSVDAVYTELVDPGDDGTTDGPPMGAPDQETMCAPHYEIHATAQLSTSDGLLDESLPVDVIAQDAGLGHLAAALSWDDVQGTAEPTDIDPLDWDRVDLTLDASAEADAWTGSLWWSAVIDDPAHEETWDTATGMGTGTVGVSGMSSAMGSFLVSR